MGYKRKQFEEVLNRINEPRDRIQVIVGPRQVGKSTLITQVLEECTLPYDNVGSGGLSFEEFLTMDLNLLFK